ncbi:MAG: arsenate reductase ArsC, partial [Deltaproteobacteria bacterium]|nr:arsenate reductase ArsC [Deltaproteobacteria bacterium]
EEIPAHEVDTVVTLCAEEVCPVFYGDAVRLRWELPDPVSAGDSEEERLESFRKVRDVLVKRIKELLV